MDDIINTEEYIQNPLITMEYKDKSSIQLAADEYIHNPAPGWRSGIQASPVNEKLAFVAGAEWMKGKAIEALKDALGRWIHGGKADRVIETFEELINK